MLNENLKQPDDAAKAARLGGSDSRKVLLLWFSLRSWRSREATRRRLKATIARIRALSGRKQRWPTFWKPSWHSARRIPRQRSKHLEAAIEKDPTNKVALFWKAQLGDREGATGEAAAIYERLVREQPVKELDDGLSLAAAANWALATLSLENQDVDQAIVRLEDLLKGGLSTEMSRPVRWQLAAARSAKGQWPAAKAEIESLLKDPKTTSEERIRAANFFRVHGETGPRSRDARRGAQSPAERLSGRGHAGFSRSARQPGECRHPAAQGD